MKKKEAILGTIRINAKSLKAYKKTKNDWKLSSKKFPEVQDVVKLFKAHRRFDELIDTKDSNFLKGQISPEGTEQGARINILPNGDKLEKAFSLFSPHLKIHDQTSHDHWDVLYQNKGGTWSYVYTLEKRKNHRARKYKKVDHFEKNYTKLTKNVTKSLRDKEDFMAVPMYTLLKTYMRVGNETYYKANGHKGLTTLTKGDIKVQGSSVVFNYIGKDGVPIKISHKFPSTYISRMQNTLRKINKNDFVFAKNKKPIREQEFKGAFARYCGHEFYPHIVRSHHATMKAKSYIRGKRKLQKEEVENLFLSIAHDLGHKKFNKKTKAWQDHYAVTVNSYIHPELVEKIQSMVR